MNFFMIDNTPICKRNSKVMGDDVRDEIKLIMKWVMTYVVR